MTKALLWEWLNDVEDNEEVNLSEILREYEEAERDLIEELEERQTFTGFYSFQDAMDAWRYERL